jgi:hypothetical protein
MFYDVKIMECKKIKPPKEIQETTAIVFHGKAKACKILVLMDK